MMRKNRTVPAPAPAPAPAPVPAADSDDEDELDDVPVLPWQSMVFADGGHEHADEHADEDDDDDVEEEESKQDNVKADDDSGRASPATMRMALLYHMLGQIAEVVAETRTDVRRMADDLRTLLPKVKADAEPTEVKAEVKAEPVEVKAEPVEVKAEPVVEVKAEPPKPAAKKPFVPDYSMPPGPTLREQEEARAAALVSAARVLAETTKRPRVDLSGTGIAGRLGVMRPTHAAMRHA